MKFSTEATFFLDVFFFAVSIFSTLERFTQLWKVSVALHLPEARLDVGERGREPAFLVRLPVIDLRATFLDATDSMHCLYRALARGSPPYRGRRLIPLFQLAVELLEGLKRLLVRRPAVVQLAPCSLLDK